MNFKEILEKVKSRIWNSRLVLFLRNLGFIQIFQFSQKLSSSNKDLRQKFNEDSFEDIEGMESALEELKESRKFHQKILAENRESGARNFRHILVVIASIIAGISFLFQAGFFSSFSFLNNIIFVIGSSMIILALIFNNLSYSTNSPTKFESLRIEEIDENLSKEEKLLAKINKESAIIAHKRLAIDLLTHFQSLSQSFLTYGILLIGIETLSSVLAPKETLILFSILLAIIFYKGRMIKNARKKQLEMLEEFEE